jgi:hypothetical protein
MIIMSSSYEPTSETAGHAATAAPIGPWPRPHDVGGERRRDAQAEQAPCERP